MTKAGLQIIRLKPAFLLSHPAHFIALGFGTGLAPIAPGTFGTLLAFPLYALIAERLSEPARALVIAGCFLVGVWACGKTGRDLGVADHGGMNWDEVVAFLGILLFTPPGAGWYAFAFFVFRFFDVVKPPPIRHIDRNIGGGFGVMFDDVVAACYTLLGLAVAKRLIG